VRDSALIEASSQPSPFTEIRAAVAFLTRLPTDRRAPGRSDNASAAVSGRRDEPARADRAPTTGAAAFAAVGVGLGVIAGGPVLALGTAHPLLAALIALAVLAIVDGGLHLDGLGDTFDALAAPPGFEDPARTDPRAGTAGVVAIIIALAVDAAALADVAARSIPAAIGAILVAATVSRAAAPVAAVLLAQRTRSSAGVGAWFAARTSPAQAVVSAATAVVLILVASAVVGPRAGVAAVAGSAIAAAFATALIATRHQLDGDGYGAIIELAFASILVATAIVG